MVQVPPLLDLQPRPDVERTARVHAEIDKPPIPRAEPDRPGPPSTRTGLRPSPTQLSAASNKRAIASWSGWRPRRFQRVRHLPAAGGCRSGPCAIVDPRSLRIADVIDRWPWSRSGAGACVDLRPTAVKCAQLHHRNLWLHCLPRPVVLSGRSGSQGVESPVRGGPGLDDRGGHDGPGPGHCWCCWPGWGCARERPPGCCSMMWTGAPPRCGSPARATITS